MTVFFWFLLQLFYFVLLADRGITSFTCSCFRFLCTIPCGIIADRLILTGMHVWVFTLGPKMICLKLSCLLTLTPFFFLCIFWFCIFVQQCCFRILMAITSTTHIEVPNRKHNTWPKHNFHYSHKPHLCFTFLTNHFYPQIQGWQYLL